MILSTTYPFYWLKIWVLPVTGLGKPLFHLPPPSYLGSLRLYTIFVLQISGPLESSEKSRISVKKLSTSPSSYFHEQAMPAWIYNLMLLHLSFDWFWLCGIGPTTETFYHMSVYIGFLRPTIPFGVHIDPTLLHCQYFCCSSPKASICFFVFILLSACATTIPGDVGEVDWCNSTLNAPVIA